VIIGAVIAAATISLRNPERIDITFLLKMDMQSIIPFFFRATGTVWA
jgi:hypothetical protein